MAFERETAITPQSIEDIVVVLYHPDPEDITKTPGANYNVQVKFSDGSIQLRSGDLVPHITQQQITALLDFMDFLRNKAHAEFIGE